MFLSVVTDSSFLFFINYETDFSFFSSTSMVVQRLSQVMESFHISFTSYICS